MDSEKTTKISDKIDNIDQEIVDKLAKRLKLVQQLTTSPALKHQWEREVLNKVKYKASINGLDAKFITAIYNLILINSNRQLKSK